MASKCPECKVDAMDVEVSLHFRAVGTGSDNWPEFPVIAGICPKCGLMDLHMATLGQFQQWLDSQKVNVHASEASALKLKW